MTSGWRSTSEGPRIVQIETRFVETDAINFRAVVQSLTGKHASTAWVGNVESHVATDSQIKGGINIAQDGDDVTVKPEEGASDDGKKNSLISCMVLKNISFKDFDRLLSELPPMEELLLL